MDNPEWEVIERTPIRDFLDTDFYTNPHGDPKKIGGDIHTTVDVNPNSPTFGEVHSTLQLPGDLPNHHSG